MNLSVSYSVMINPEQLTIHYLTNVNFFIFCRWVTSYMIRHRKNRPDEITEDDLVEVHASILKFHNSFKSTIATVMKSEGQTIKYHRLSHVVSSIKRLGPIREYNAQFFEASNKDDKTAYRTTSARLTDDEHLAGMVVNQELRRALESRSTFDQDNLVKKRQSAYMKAATSGENALTKKHVCSFTVGTRINDMSKAGHTFFMDIEDREDIFKAICTHYNCTYTQGITPDMPVVRTKATAVLAANVPWLLDATELQTVRATPNFFGKPYFDTVEVERKERGRSSIKYGRLRLIFQARLDENKPWENLVCVRMMQETRNHDILTSHGCRHFQWADGANKYVVYPLKSVSRRVYMPIDYNNTHVEAFHMSTFKWTRTPAEL
jgi:hypothetical protein